MSQSLDDSVLIVAYYCHSCHESLDFISRENTCSKCNSEFIEEMQIKSMKSCESKPLESESVVSIKEKSLNLCSVCLESNTNDSKTLKCKHVFHKECIKSWIQTNRSCPLCRASAIMRDISTPTQAIASHQRLHTHKSVGQLVEEFFRGGLQEH